MPKDPSPVDPTEFFYDLIEQIQASLRYIAIEYLLKYAGALAVIIIIYGGIKYITGGPKEVENAKGIIIAALIGLAIIAFSYVIINIVLKIV